VIDPDAVLEPWDDDGVPVEQAAAVWAQLDGVAGGVAGWAVDDRVVLGNFSLRSGFTIRVGDQRKLRKG